MLQMLRWKHHAVPALQAESVQHEHRRNFGGDQAAKLVYCYVLKGMKNHVTPLHLLAP